MTNENDYILLDLFCCAGGAGKGYERAGFRVFSVDIDHVRKAVAA